MLILGHFSRDVHKFARTRRRWNGRPSCALFPAVSKPPASPVLASRRAGDQIHGAPFPAFAPLGPPWTKGPDTSLMDTIQSEVNPVSWAKINFHLMDALANRPPMAGVPFFHSSDAHQHGRFTSNIPKAVQPIRKGRALSSKDCPAHFRERLKVTPPFRHPPTALPTRRAVFVREDSASQRF